MIKWTLYRKIQLIIFLFMVVIFSISHFTLTELVEENTRRNFLDTVVNTAVLLQQNNEVIFNDATNTLDFIKNVYADRTRDDEYIDHYLRIMNETKDYIVNSFVAYNDSSYVLIPNADLPDSFDPRTRAWYEQAYNARGIVWSEPYIDIATMELVITGSVYIELEDMDGVIGLDIKLESLPGVINNTRIGENGFTLLVNSEQLIIGSSVDLYRGKTLGVLGDDVFLNSNLISGYMDTDKGLYYVRRLNKTNLRLVTFLPKYDITIATEEAGDISRLVMVIALVIGFIILYFSARRITMPISKLTEVMEKSKHEEALITFEEETNDEINTLIKGYNDMVVSVNEQNSHLKKISSELKKSEQKLQEQYDKASHLAYYDYLTGMPNRISFEEHAKLLINDHQVFALFYIDLDNFKYVNDTYGHNYGDFVLQIIARRFKNCCQASYFSARLSGDEFGLLVTENSKQSVEEIAEHILKIVNEPISFNELDFHITGSIGISSFPLDGKSFEDIMSNADIAMYEAKNKAKNQYMIFDTELRSRMVDRVSIENRMQTALEENEFYLAYQPLYILDSKKLYGFEALVRWQSPDLGLLMPNTFIPIAEHNLFINKLGYFVLEEAIKFGKQLYDEFDQYYEMNVNVSIIQLYLDEFINDVKYLLNKYKFPKKYLNLEITESVALDEDETIRNKLNQLLESGIKISLDDFGTGYSSINHLISIQLSHLKIDRFIIQEAVTKDVVNKLLLGVVEFAHAIDVKVIAEGIEDTVMENMVRALNIDIGQGYMYSRPIKEDEVRQFLSD